MANLSQFTRRGFLGVAATAGLAGVVGCTKQTPQSSPSIPVPSDLASDGAAHKGSKLTMLSQKLYSNTANKALDESLQAFAQATGTTIENSQAGADTGDLVAKTDAAIKAGNARDLAFFTDSRFIAQFQNLGDLTDVTDVVEELIKKFGQPASESKTYCTFDGRWFAIPYQFIGIGAFARKDWLTDKGIELKQSYDWKEMRDICLEISDPAKRRFGWGITINRSGDGSSFIENVINCWGGSINDNSGRKVTFNSPETVDAVTFIAELFQSDKYKPMMPPGIESWTDSSNNENWMAGITGFTRNQYSVYADSKAQKNPVYDNTHPFVDCYGPATERPLSVGQSQALVVLKGSKNAELAKAVAKFLVSGPALLNIAKSATGLAMPAWEKVWESDPFYTDGDPAFKALHSQATQDLPIRTKGGLAFPQTPNSGQQAAQASFVLTDMMQTILKGTSPKQAIADTHQNIVKLFEQAGIEQ